MPYLKPTFGWLEHIGDCREGVIPRSLLRFQAMMPRSLLRGISLYRIYQEIVCRQRKNRMDIGRGKKDIL